MSFPLLVFSRGSETLSDMGLHQGSKWPTPRGALVGRGQRAHFSGEQSVHGPVRVAVMIPNWRALLTWLFCECLDGFSLFSPAWPWPAPGHQLCPPSPPACSPLPSEVPSSSVSCSQPPPLVAASPKGVSLPLTRRKHCKLQSFLEREGYTGRSLAWRIARGLALKGLTGAWRDSYHTNK